ncbi:hypothetical protein AXE80_06945 [Wenyingzhuangia fucanilytica]|uniref:Uncharacterized protein n=1 Tax=Wenyingzhuangia fucanilytica TaxID=1790137 RepID=A0A1B1Y5H2_9FLAO|nr:hypothetical protein AXE80_06945 [Wenyingzhuangia fucanilytica]
MLGFIGDGHKNSCLFLFSVLYNYGVNVSAYKVVIGVNKTIIPFVVFFKFDGLPHIQQQMYCQFYL